MDMGLYAAASKQSGVSGPRLKPPEIQTTTYDRLARHCDTPATVVPAGCGHTTTIACLHPMGWMPMHLQKTCIYTVHARDGINHVQSIPQPCFQTVYQRFRHITHSTSQASTYIQSKQPRRCIASTSTAFLPVLLHLDAPYHMIAIP